MPPKPKALIDLDAEEALLVAKALNFHESALYGENDRIQAEALRGGLIPQAALAAINDAFHDEATKARWLRDKFQKLAAPVPDRNEPPASDASLPPGLKQAEESLFSHLCVQGVDAVVGSGMVVSPDGGGKWRLEVRVGRGVVNEAPIPATWDRFPVAVVPLEGGA